MSYSYGYIIKACSLTSAEYEKAYPVACLIWTSGRQDNRAGPNTNLRGRDRAYWCSRRQDSLLCSMRPAGSSEKEMPERNTPEQREPITLIWKLWPSALRLGPWLNGPGQHSEGKIRSELIASPEKPSSTAPTPPRPILEHHQGGQPLVTPPSGPPLLRRPNSLWPGSNLPTSTGIHPKLTRAIKPYESNWLLLPE